MEREELECHEPHWEDYEACWAELSSAMLQQMEIMHQALQSALPSDQVVTSPKADCDGDVWKVAMDIRTKADVFLVSIEFSLLDGEEHGEEGFAVSLSADDANAALGLGYQPKIYTEEAFTFDKEELLNRVEEFDALGFVSLYFRTVDEMQQAPSPC